MPFSPAAVAISDARSERTDPRDRLVDLLERVAPDSAPQLVERLLPAPLSASRAELSWLAIPCKLAASLGLDGTPRGRTLLEDLCWLQCCVYGVFRLQDDLLDGDSTDPTLAVRTNHLLVEAARCAARHFDGDSPFWAVFHETIDATSRAIVELDRLQRSGDRDPRDELRLYADLSACLKIASAGVCFATGQGRAWSERLSPALDAFAVAGQIVDDLRDIREDLEAGCLNHAAWFLSHPIFSTVPDAVEAVVASNLATTDRLERLLGRAGATMDTALDRLDETLCPAVYDYLREYRLGLVGLAARIQRSATVVLTGSTQNR